MAFSSPFGLCKKHTTVRCLWTADSESKTSFLIWSYFPAVLASTRHKRGKITLNKERMAVRKESSPVVRSATRASTQSIKLLFNLKVLDLRVFNCPLISGERFQFLKGTLNSRMTLLFL